jgi:ectoine hydroxylase-related dioxygenase (phytanoyl-CoA dioxygenase family)
MLTPEQVQSYKDNGYIALSNILSDSEIAHLCAVTDDFLERSRSVTKSDDVFDLEEGHTAEHPRLRRIKRPIKQHPAYEQILHHPGLLAVLQQLMGPAIRHYGLKLNLKPGGGGEPVEWHQDWAYYPHTNDDLCVLGIMLDDVTPENGPLLVVPGSHKGPVLDHHQDGMFVGAVTDPAAEAMYPKAVPLLGKVGDITIHHTRTLHGSGANLSPGYRRILFLTLRAADAWPLTEMPESLEAFNDMMLVGETPASPRLENVPVRLPLPRPVDWLARRDSIFEKQRDLRNSPFARPEKTRLGAAAD